MDRILKHLTWAAALYIAFILMWYEQFKLTGNAGSVELFTTLATWLHIPDYEKPFRLTVAVAEICAAVLVVIPATRILGAALTLGLMSGAIFFHVASPLGIDPYDDGAVLFREACATWASAMFILFAFRHEALALLKAAVNRVNDQGSAGQGP